MAGNLTTLARASRQLTALYVKQTLRSIHKTNSSTRYGQGKRNSVWKYFRNPWFAAVAVSSVGSLSWIGYKYMVKKDDFIKVTRVYAKSQDSDIDRDNKMPRSKQYNFIAQAVEMTAPTVVHVETAATNRTMFGDVVMHGSGSGFIISEDGLVLTNAHVIERAYAVKVKLYDGSELAGEVIDVDIDADLALIKLKTKKKLPAMALGSSSQLRPGEWVIAMGSPLSLTNTITAGIVSTVHREVPGLHSGIQYIQTDAAINDGEAIGINTMKAVVSGISFAIPIDVAKEFLKNAQLRSSTSKTRRSRMDYYIGISMLTLTPSILGEIQARTDKLDDITTGVFLPNVAAGSPAYRAGLRGGDVITEVNGKSVKASKEIYNIVKAGEAMQVKVRRGTDDFTFFVTPESKF
ncbi:uncharacterized protein TRIADDRAFT_58565 [Trichoplax adhaerens]|uniref:PDZ domain-containing protein n=1 Tax=Trichoplax adhaerens TaxID=10228 RepID=B3S320_TRIAD|nr:hypothetical protein TRIADDRAFT_58565 [Trichoplax adhaerens]EDV22717.1 hypothetical protein TRIADDRAFT_58565 [Trichoplax adhaerens]|eukprot:XP_002114583.1 hypothetical protein TRIADDRAFT_58565 [Trichoplax adhaerens]